MEILTAGLIIFFGVHVFTGAREARAHLIAKLGEKSYKGIYSVLSLLGLILIVWGKAQAPAEPFWNPPAWGRGLALGMMPFAFIGIAASHMPTNLKRFTAHPMMWGITLWAVLHLLSNGDRASAALFGAFALYSVYAIVAQNRRGVKPTGLAVPGTKDLTVIIAGLAVWAAFYFGHGWLFGVPLWSQS